MRLSACVVMVWALLGNVMALAADNKDVARQAYAEGTRYYDLNDFGHALEAFKRAYLAYEEPAFLYNIAQCHRQLGNNAEAVKFYRSYLRKVPDAANRGEVERLIATLESQPAQQKSSTPGATIAPAAPPSISALHPSVTAAPGSAATTLAASAPPPPRHVPVYKKWWLWTIVGVAAAGVAIGVAVAITSQRNEPSFMPVTVSQ